MERLEARARAFLRDRPRVAAVVRPVARGVQTAMLGAISSLARFAPEDALIVFGNSRGGSTWLAETLRSIPKTCMIWEPEEVNLGETQFTRIGFGLSQQIPISADWPEARRVFGQLFRGQGLDARNTYYERANILVYLTADTLIVKFVSSNGLAPWLCRQFDFRRKPVLLLRHPMAIAASRLRHGAWDKMPESYDFPKARFDCLNAKHRDYLSMLKGREEVLIAKWCIENLTTLQVAESENSPFYKIFYEDLVLDRRTAIEKLFSEWKLYLSSAAIERSTKASFTTVAGSPLYGRDQLGHWRKSFSAIQTRRMQDVLDHFSIKTYSWESDEPLRS